MNQYNIPTTLKDYKAIAKEIRQQGTAAIPVMLASKHGVPVARIKEIMKYLLK